MGMSIIQDRKATGVVGGAGTGGGTYDTRDLNTIINYGNIDCILETSTSKFTLGPGKYYVIASAPAYAVNRFIIKLRNTTDSINVVFGCSSFTTAPGSAQTRSVINGIVTIDSSKEFEIQQAIQTNTSGFDFGVDAGDFMTVDYELYTEVLIYRLY